ncbi:MAG TPA: efflux RND transporter periplasmic adaptor subunit [Nevskiaceae bacterium]|nr:efflux RND transporter periplasmic adaptor subunit [Nevskiaceae bacterium]
MKKPNTLTAALYAAGLSLAVLTVAACSSSQAQPSAAPPAPSVSVAQVVLRDVTQWDEFNGRVQAVESVEIRPRVSGYIDRVNFAEGKEVHKGDVLFVIDQRSYRAELERAQADLARTRAQADLAHAEAARAEKLIELHAISREEHDERVAADAQAGAAVRAAEAAASIARLNLEFTEVRSPIDGRAGQALVTAGNLVSAQPAATLLTTVVSLDPVYVYFEGDEQTYLRYGELARRGERPSSRDARNPVFVGLGNEDGFPHEGVMDFVDNQVDPATGTIRARAVLSNKDRVFSPGLFARVKLVGSGTAPALLIDDKAVLTDQDRKYVYVLGADNKAERRDVKIGRLNDGMRVVLEGLSAGDKVIVHGVQKIFFPGMQVAPETIAMGEGPRDGEPIRIAVSKSGKAEPRS